jgi:hypothetical protein
MHIDCRQPVGGRQAQNRPRTYVMGISVAQYEAFLKGTASPPQYRCTPLQPIRPPQRPALVLEQSASPPLPPNTLPPAAPATCMLVPRQGGPFTFFDKRLLPTQPPPEPEDTLTDVPWCPTVEVAMPWEAPQPSAPPLVEQGPLQRPPQRSVPQAMELSPPQLEQTLLAASTQPTPARPKPSVAGSVLATLASLPPYALYALLGRFLSATALDKYITELCALHKRSRRARAHSGRSDRR